MMCGAIRNTLTVTVAASGLWTALFRVCEASVIAAHSLPVCLSQDGSFALFLVTTYVVFFFGMHTISSLMVYIERE